MSNWVGGTITFKGPQKELEKLHAALTPGGKLSMAGISPVPEDLLPANSPYQEAAVYVWNKDHPLSEHDESLLDALFSYDSWDELLEEGRVKAMIGSAEDKANFIKLGRRCIRCLNKYRCATRMDWCIRNWGVKWDFSEEDELGMPFDGLMDFAVCTPWDFPFPFFETLAKKFPAVSFTGSYSEDSSNAANRGYISASGGAFSIDQRPDDLEIYMALWGDNEN